MDSQKNDSKIWINDFQRLYGSLDPEMLENAPGLLNIGDQNKFNQCLKHLRRLTNGLSRDYVRVIFLLIFMVHYHFQAEKYIKPLRDKIKSRFTKEKYRDLEKNKKLIEKMKSLDPDPSMFKEKFLNLAKKQSNRKNPVLPTLEWKINLLTLDDERTIYLIKLMEKKGYDKKIVNQFIYGVYDTVKLHGSTLTKSAIGSHISSLLTILTGKEYSRENVLGILGRQMPKTN